MATARVATYNVCSARGSTSIALAADIVTRNAMCISTGTREVSIDDGGPIAAIARLYRLERVAICAATSTTTTADRTASRRRARGAVLRRDLAVPPIEPGRLRARAPMMPRHLPRRRCRIHRDRSIIVSQVARSSDQRFSRLDAGITVVLQW
jgi:hypothetical protein